MVSLSFIKMEKNSHMDIFIKYHNVFVTEGGETRAATLAFAPK